MGPVCDVLEEAVYKFKLGVAALLNCIELSSFWKKLYILFDKRKVPYRTAGALDKLRDVVRGHTFYHSWTHNAENSEPAFIYD